MDMALPGVDLRQCPPLAWPRRAALRRRTSYSTPRRPSTLGFQLFNAFNARSSEQSVFGACSQSLAVAGGFLGAVRGSWLSTFMRGIQHVPLRPVDWLLCVAVGSTVIWPSEIAKFLRRREKS
jgi:hypothetical protein